MVPYSTCLNMAVGGSYVVALPGGGAQQVKLTARAECYVKPIFGPQSAAPAALGATPAPNAGAEAQGFVHLVSTDLPTPIGDGNPSDPPITYLLVWGIAAGKLEISAR